MKTKMTLLAFSFFCASLALKSQTTENTRYPETMVIKILESSSFGIANNIESKMIIVDSDNQTTIKPMKRVNYNLDLNEGLEENTQKLRQELQIWNNKGFEVKSMSSATPRDYLTITTIVLQKA